jgi:hypothetical protein
MHWFSGLQKKRTSWRDALQVEGYSRAILAFAMTRRQNFEQHDVMYQALPEMQAQLVWHAAHPCQMIFSLFVSSKS